MRPPSITATRSQISLITGISWVISRMVMPRSRLTCLQQRQDRLRRLGVERRGRLVAEQHLGVGRQRPGDADALLLPARQLGRIARALVGEPDQREQPRRPAPRSRALGAPAISSGSATLSKTVREDNRLKCWKIMPVLRRRARQPASLSPVTSSPSIRMRPDVACSSPLTRRISVDLPAPERPMTPRIAPLRHVEVDAPTGRVTALWPVAAGKGFPDLLEADDRPGGRARRPARRETRRA